MVATKRNPPVDQTFEDIKAHSSANRINTHLAVTESLRRNFSDYHVTCADPSNCDFLGFAAAGHAQTTPVLEEDLFDLTRGYKKPKNRTEPGQLGSEVRFGQHWYRWREVDFVVFEANFVEDGYRHVSLMYFLTPRNQGIITNGFHSITEELMLEVGAWTRVLHNEVYVFDNARWSKSKDLWKAVHGSSWDDVILNPATKQGIIEDVHGFFDNKDLYREFAVPWKRGIILHGLPGNGKTLSIRALMSSLYSRTDSIPTLYAKSLVSCDGPQYSVRAIFSQARAAAPCLLIFEDLDSLIVEKVRSYFLNEVDGLESNDGILMIGTTNHLAKLDPAISKRPSRFDRKYHFDIPREEDRTAYCAYWKKKMSKNNSVDFPQELCPIISKLTEGFTFAYMKELFVASLLVVARGGKGEEAAEVVVDEKPEESNQHTIRESETGPPAEETASHDAPEESSKAKQKRVLPEVHIPDALRDNILLRVFVQQATILLTEMDSTDPDQWKSSAVRFTGEDSRSMRYATARVYDDDVDDESEEEGNSLSASEEYEVQLALIRAHSG